MNLAEDLPPNSAVPVTSKRRSWPRAALAFRAARQWVITRPGVSAGRGRPSSHGTKPPGWLRLLQHTSTRGQYTLSFSRTLLETAHTCVDIESHGPDFR